ncbi:hypothetical protein [Granulicella tundricola]|uniref:Uncharacterized protein n=1 Tax=Granulicella tundricola (strain ATCC BAA-1859 / DSM 23138 / MP5ACTX9) TaxID=1198114 RepID=E8X0R9_GRATM|nr:hypothetical protein [Granulicella tundricola]ADW69020.1 hypothetical protein AciX9_1974 [Granulicella tundricola MP5ACTX9]
MLNTITLNGQTVSIVASPTCIALRSIELSGSDSVAIVTSPFSGQTQAQQWPGADWWSGTATLPPLTQDQADEWLSFLMECRGMTNPFLMGDPLKSSPRGSVTSASVPVVDMSVTTLNQVGNQVLYTKGWLPNAFSLLLPGDYLQIGYRLHRCLDRVNSDANGKASFSIFPSLRDLPADGQPIILNNPQGLFRRGSNKMTWSSDYTGLTNLSFPLIEYR